MTSLDDARLDALLAQLSLDEKVALVSGADFWTTVPLPSIGLRAMTLSDGPAGVRGPVWDERSPSLNMPSGTALGASWDPELAYRYGAAAAAEARRKDVDVVLGPTINLHRSPLGGRHFEALSEDPQITGALAAAYVRGLQDNGVAATPKHYVANDSETDRFTVDVDVDERALRELYLRPFEDAVEAGAWAIMSSYNAVDGVTLTENDLLETPLNSEWGFDGVVISDWTAVRSLGSATASQDLAMPGPAPAWSAALVEAVRDGRVPESAVDRKARRVLLLAARVGALEGFDAVAAQPLDDVAFVKEAGVEGTVLLRNEGELPWSAAPASIAVIGHNAREARTQGGGSATVLPERIVSPLEGVRAAFPAASVAYEVGAVVQEGVAEIPLDRIVNPVTGEHGARVAFLDADGVELFHEDRRSTALVWFGGDVPIARSSMIVLETVFTPEEDASIRLGFASAEHGRIIVDDELLLEETPIVEGTDLGAAFLNPPSATVLVRTRAGQPLRIRAEFDLTNDPDSPLAGVASLTLGLAPDDTDPDALLARAVEAARAAEVAVVVVGTNSKVESEGYDREHLDLPGRQDELVRAVAAVNPRTVVIVNAGAPVLLPWRDEVAAVVLGYFGGQEFGTAIAEVLSGAAEPGGRLTTTWPATLEQVPVLDVTPRDGVLRYDEGIHIGYRAWLRAGAEPAWPFGFGLGYTTWSLDGAEVEGSLADDDATVTLRIANTGDRAGKQVVQVYAEREDSAVDRPVRWLVGSVVVRLEAGAEQRASVPIPARSLSHWVGDRDGHWALETGVYRLRVGVSSVDLPIETSLEG